ncbi:hypothetical protein HMI54_003790 [Coelomomyces lativittatus]|nr:hypothetical protein HMI54_003790 [Coelomomyces lativittatus]
MGIRGLDKYIRSHDMTEDFYFPRDPLSNLCDSLLDCYLDSAVDSNETHVENHTYDQIPIVISGRSLMHFLYRENLECILGGQYEKFKEIILEFFNSLKRYQIKVEGIVFNCMLIHVLLDLFNFFFLSQKKKVLDGNVLRATSLIR